MAESDAPPNECSSGFAKLVCLTFRFLAVSISVLLHLFVWAPTPHSYPDEVTNPYSPIELIVALFASLLMLTATTKRKWYWFVIVSISMFIISVCAPFLWNKYESGA